MGLLQYMHCGAASLARRPGVDSSKICRPASSPGTRLRPCTLPFPRRASVPHVTRAQASDLSQPRNNHPSNGHDPPSPLLASRPPSSCLTMNRDILPGEVIDFPGVVLVKGDVCNGAAIHASGDVIVLGKLEGNAIAGKNGDTNAVIFAWDLTPTTLSIAGYDIEPSTIIGNQFYKVASLSDNQVRIRDACTKDARLLPSTSDNDHASVRLPTDLRSMRRSSKVAIFTGAYIFIAGLALLISPESLGYFFDLKTSIMEWIRFIAVLAMVFGVYYIGTAWGDAKGYNGANSFYTSTIVGRVFIFLSFSWMAVNGALGLPLFVVGTVNLIGALTMHIALRKERMEQKGA